MQLFVKEAKSDHAQLNLNFSTPVKLAKRFNNDELDLSYILKAFILQAFDH